MRSYKGQAVYENILKEQTCGRHGRQILLTLSHSTKKQYKKTYTQYIILRSYTHSTHFPLLSISENAEKKIFHEKSISLICPKFLDTTDPVFSKERPQMHNAASSNLDNATYQDSYYGLAKRLSKNLQLLQYIHKICLHFLAYKINVLKWF